MTSSTANRHAGHRGSTGRPIVPIKAVVVLLLALAASTLVATGPVSAKTGSDAIGIAEPDGLDPDPSPETGVFASQSDGNFRFEGFRFEASPSRSTGKFVARGGAKGYFNNCFIDFNDDTVISFLPNQASTTFVEWPFWNQECLVDGTAISVQPIGNVGHYHLNYVDETLRFCTDLGDFGRPLDPDDVTSSCTAIDPVTEPRSGVQTHSQGYGIRIFAYDIATKDRVQFDLNQLRILSGDAELCFVHTDLPWITSEPTTDHAGYCGDLGAGNWDVSATVTDAYEVRVWSQSPNMSFTDIGITV